MKIICTLLHLQTTNKPKHKNLVVIDYRTGRSDEPMFGSPLRAFAAHKHKEKNKMQLLTHLSRMALPSRISRTSPFPILEALGGIFHFYSNFNTKNILLANSENSDQMPHSVASDLGLHCLPVSHKKKAEAYMVLYKK